MAVLKTEGRVALRGWLSKHERSVSWLARMLGVSTTTIHSWLSGKSRPLHFHRECIEDLTRIASCEWFTKKELAIMNESKKRIASYHRNNHQ